MMWVKGQNPLHQIPRSKSATSLQQVGTGKSPLCLLCCFPNSITTTCCQLVAD